jgi:protein-S-isoprenylcysteine O-methyltransferase Ste14
VSKCRKRLILWLVLLFASVAGGLVIDLTLRTRPFPVFVRLLGLAGMLLAHFPLKRTGRLLRIMGESKPGEWGCTTRLITTDVYQCVRHPHHFWIGVFVPSLALLIGYPWTFFIMTVIQWSWIIGFLFLVEEKELLEKFGEEYKAYRQQVPMLFPNISCTLKTFSKPIDAATTSATDA